MTCKPECKPGAHAEGCRQLSEYTSKCGCLCAEDARRLRAALESLQAVAHKLAEEKAFTKTLLERNERQRKGWDQAESLLAKVRELLAPMVEVLGDDE